MEIKYAFDRNIGNSISDNRNFEIKNKGESKFEVKSKQNYIQSVNYKPTIEFSQTFTHRSKPIIELGENIKGGDRLNPTYSNGAKKAGSKSNLNNVGKTGNNQPQQKMNQKQFEAQQISRKQRKKANGRDTSECSSGSNASKVEPQQQPKANQPANLEKPTQQQQTGVKVDKPIPEADHAKVNSLKSNPNTTLFAKGPPLLETPSPAGFSSLNKLNYNSPDFKSTNYLEDKNKHYQVNITKTYYSNKPQTAGIPAAAAGYTSAPLATTPNYNQSTANSNQFAPRNLTSTSPLSSGTRPAGADGFGISPAKSTEIKADAMPKQSTIPKQPSNGTPNASKTNHFASSKTKETKKDDGCVIC